MIVLWMSADPFEMRTAPRLLVPVSRLKAIVVLTIEVAPLMERPLIPAAEFPEIVLSATTFVTPGCVKSWAPPTPPSALLPETVDCAMVAPAKARSPPTVPGVLGRPDARLLETVEYCMRSVPPTSIPPTSAMLPDELATALQSMLACSRTAEP